MVSIFDYFFAQCYFYVRVTLWGQNRWQAVSPWGARSRQFLGQSQGSLHTHSHPDGKLAAGAPAPRPGCERRAPLGGSQPAARREAVWGEEAVAGRRDPANLPEVTSVK